MILQKCLPPCVHPFSAPASHSYLHDFFPFCFLACLPAGYLERASAVKRAEAVAVPFSFPPSPMGMHGWMVRGRSAPSLHMFCFLRLLPLIHLVLACLLLLSFLATWSVRSWRSGARALRFLFHSIFLLWVGTTWDVFWRTVRTIALSTCWLLSCVRFLKDSGILF